MTAKIHKMQVQNASGDILEFEVIFEADGEFLVRPVGINGNRRTPGLKVARWTGQELGCTAPPAHTWQQTYTASANPAASYNVGIPDNLTMYPLTPTAKKHASPAAPVHRCSWVTYTGFIETFEYCSDHKCGKRKVPVGS